ncbi:MAG TPA: nuclear transport factor 2 family protein [Ferruginibacter sp.]|nr:nuclear transport factor 2 family protein [Ferruginibacter sp.]
MESNRDEIINKFYSAFNKLDHATMNSCYSEDIAFHDPVFGLLQGFQVRAMWEMLCKNATDLSITWMNIQHLDEEYSTCEWTAKYTFSKTGRPIVNHIKANMRFADGKVTEHSDAFSLHNWSKQAFGFTGWLFGWNSFYQNKIKIAARRKLAEYIEKQV